MLEIGMTYTLKETVTEDKTAAHLGSGMLEVYATPAMIALMEKTAMMSVAEELDKGCGTVGTLVNAEHIAASPLGAEIICESRLTEIDGRKLTFEITASDNAGIIGKATHCRFIIDNARFMAKTLAKLEKQEG